MKKKYKTAMTYFDKALEIGEYDPDVLLLKANCLFKTGKINDSMKCCDKIKEVDSKNKGVEELLLKISKLKEK